MTAKIGELMIAGVSDFSPAAIHKAISKGELTYHCTKKDKRGH